MNYLQRHKKNENWNDYMSAGSLAKHLLWGPSTSLRENIKTFKKRLHFFAIKRCTFNHSKIQKNTM
ncbi:MAG: hypothetical protein EBS19_16760 [Spirochaetia bacterium]|nr:hypothetical protein [Spirochaetia bacterium]